jgi:hypothetical protein
LNAFGCRREPLPRRRIIDWFNHRRLHGEISTDNTYTTPAEFESLFYRRNQAVYGTVTHCTQK